MANATVDPTSHSWRKHKVRDLASILGLALTDLAIFATIYCVLLDFEMRRLTKRQILRALLRRFHNFLWQPTTAPFEESPRVVQIEIDSQGVAWLAGTQVKVVEIVLDKLAHGWSPEEIHFQHHHLSMAQIHVALTYFYENQDLLDEQIGQRMYASSALARRSSDSAFRNKLTAVKSSL